VTSLGFFFLPWCIPSLALVDEMKMKNEDGFLIWLLGDVEVSFCSANDRICPLVVVVAVRGDRRLDL
jgi:hypothetical protein